MKRLMTMALLALAASFGTQVSAQPVELRMAFPAPPTSFVNTASFTPWVKDVEAASNGTLTIRIVPGLTLANIENVFDRTVKGVADIGFGLHAAVGGQFPKSMVAALPFEFDSPRESAPALWRLHQSGVIADEYKDVKVLALFTFGHAAIHTRTARIKSLADIKGLKIRAGGKLEGDIVAALGAAPITMNTAPMNPADVNK